MSNNSPILKGENLYKRFEGVIAVDGINSTLYEGDILGLIGENGAGKSTLVKLLTGEYNKDSGQVFYHNKKVNWGNTYEAMIEGVGLVHQRPTLVSYLTAAENIFLGKEFTKYGLLNNSKIQIEAEKLLNKYPLNPSFNLNLIASEMSAGQREITEILKVLSFYPKVLILDEPTASLTDDESKRLISIIKKLNKEEGLSVIFISHRMEEVFDLCTKIEVLRNAKSVGFINKKDFNRNKIIHMIINRELTDFYPQKASELGKCVLEAKGLCSDEIKDITIKVNAGEIVGLYGISGAGMTETVESIFGLRKIDTGKLYIDGQELKNIKVFDLINRNIFLVPEDRDTKGLFAEFTLRENMTISHLKYLLPGFIINKKKEQSIVKKGIRNFEILYSDIDQDINTLSGGNQQKVVIAKWLLKDCDVLILNDPTVGVDIGTKREIYLMLRKLTSEGKGIILVSSEILEIIGMADRVYTMREGSVSSELLGNEINQKNILEHVL